MKWTSEPPKAPGYYWRRIPLPNGRAFTSGGSLLIEQPPILCEVVRRFNGDLWMVPLWPSHVSPWRLADQQFAMIRSEWAGPVEPPS